MHESAHTCLYCGIDDVLWAPGRQAFICLPCLLKRWEVEDAGMRATEMETLMHRASASETEARCRRMQHELPPGLTSTIEQLHRTRGKLEQVVRDQSRRIAVLEAANEQLRKERCTP